MTTRAWASDQKLFDVEAFVADPAVERLDVLLDLVCGSKDFSQMNRAHSGSDPAEPAADLHEARRVAGGAHLRPGCDDVGHFVREHGRRSVGILDRECSAKAATRVRHGQFNQRHAELDEPINADFCAAASSRGLVLARRGGVGEPADHLVE